MQVCVFESLKNIVKNDAVTLLINGSGRSAWCWSVRANGNAVFICNFGVLNSSDAISQLLINAWPVYADEPLWMRSQAETDRTHRPQSSQPHLYQSVREWKRNVHEMISALLIFRPVSIVTIRPIEMLIQGTRLLSEEALCWYTKWFLLFRSSVLHRFTIRLGLWNKPQHQFRLSQFDRCFKIKYPTRTR